MRHAVLPAAILLLAAAPAVASDILTYTGASTISLSILYAGAIRDFEAKTGHRFESVDSQSGTGMGLDKLAAGKATLCGAGRDLTEQERSKGLVQHTIGYDAIALWTNRGNPVTNLTRAQAKALLTGRARNWSEVGGLDVPVRLVLEPLEEKRASIELVQSLLLDNQPIASQGALVQSHRDQIVTVSQDPGALCLASQGLASTFNTAIRHKVRMLSIDGKAPEPATIAAHSYAIARPLNLVSKGPPAGKVKAFIDFMLSPEGQAIVAKSFVPVAPPPPPPARGR